MHSMTRRLLALAAGLAPLVGAHAGSDPELAAVVRGAQALVRVGQSGRAEALLESLTRSRPDDPRAWYFLAELRAGLKAARGATYAYHRAAGLASPGRRARIQQRLEAHKLPAAPARDQVGDPVEFLDRARSELCGMQERTGTVYGGLSCDGVRRIAPSDFRITKKVLLATARSEEEWVRVQTAAHAPLAAFRSRYLLWLRRDPSPLVRETLLRRLVSGAGEIELPPAAVEVVEELTRDPDLEVRLAAADFAFRRGDVPALAPADFRELVLRVDRGQASKAMARRILKAHVDALRDELVQVLAGPGFEGKAAAIMLLCLDGGRSGQRAVARALVEGRGGLVHFQAHAYQGLAMATRGEGLELGGNPSQWLEALGG